MKDFAFGSGCLPTRSNESGPMAKSWHLEPDDRVKAVQLKKVKWPLGVVHKWRHTNFVVSLPWLSLLKWVAFKLLKLVVSSNCSNIILRIISRKEVELMLKDK